MPARVRPYVSEDLEPLVALSLRAWAPVFASLQAALGERLFGRLRGDWRESQAADVRGVLNEQGTNIWVAESDAQVAGFVAAKLQPSVGEIVMIAVDPHKQRTGIASLLTETATQWLREKGASVVMVETGGDSGHLAARRTYEAAGFTPLAITRYFKVL